MTRTPTGVLVQLGFLIAALMMSGGTRVDALVITPTWGTALLNDPNVAVIQNTIMTAIQFYEARFSDPITVTIQFEEVTTGLGHSSWWYYPIPYSTFRAALLSDARTTNDALAVAHLPSGANNPVTTNSNIRVKTANLHALGFTGYASGLAGGVDGIITLNISRMNLTRTSINSSKYDLMALTAHEIDEVLGLASALDSGSTTPLPEDLFRYDSNGNRTYTTSGDNAYFSLDGTNLLARFNQNSSEDYGDWWTAGTHTPQVQDAFSTPGATPNPLVELTALDAIGYDLVSLPRPGITRMSLSGTDLVINGTNGFASGIYQLLTSGDVTRPLNQWTPVATNMLFMSGDFTFTAVNAFAPNPSQHFYILRLQ